MLLSWPSTYARSRNADRPAVRQLTIAAFEGVSIDHNIDLRLGLVRGPRLAVRKSRDIDRDIDVLGATACRRPGRTTRERCCGLRHDAVRPRDARSAGFTTWPWRREARGQGLGRRLIEHALAHFRAAGMTIAKIETLEQNAVGRHLYPSMGFVEVARQIHYAMRSLGSTSPWSPDPKLL